MAVFQTLPPLLAPAARSIRASALYNAAAASNVASALMAAPPNSWQTEHAESSLAQRLSSDQNLTSTQARRSQAALHGSTRASSESAIVAHLPDYVVWAVNQAIANSDQHRLRQDHLKTAAIQDPQVEEIKSANLPPTRSSLLHLVTVSPSRYAAILAVLTEVRQRLATSGAEETFPSWTPETVVDYDCSASEGLWASAKAFESDGLARYYGFDRRSHMLKAGKRLAESVLLTPQSYQAENPPKQLETLELDEQVFQAEVDSEEPPKAPAFYEGASSSTISGIKQDFLSIPLDAEEMKTDSSRTMALSAFSFSLMTNDLHRAEAVQKMWDSGAEVIVLIDQASRRGFASIASARSQLLELGDSHVVAPCPHDRSCPLLNPFVVPTNQICSFSSRLATPSFLRKTRHSKRSEDDIGYSYVVVRRGARPTLQAEAERRGGIEEHLANLTIRADQSKTGILDMLRGTKAAPKERRVLEEVGGEKQLEWLVEEDAEAKEELMKFLPDALKREMEKAGLQDLDGTQMERLLSQMDDAPRSQPPQEDDLSDSHLEESEFSSQEDMLPDTLPSDSHPDTTLAMRLQSFSWPRLIHPPLKNGGHVTFDACCPSGNVERFTVAKSAGRQAYQDARKAKWGDLFPHASKNGKSIVRVQGPSANDKVLRKKEMTRRAIEVVVDEDEDALDGLFESDEEAEARLNASEPQSDASTSPKAGSHKLISPDTLAPTPMQKRKQSKSRATKWEPLPTISRKAGAQTSVLSPDETTQSLRRKQNRASRKRSRGDYDDELY